MLRLIWAAAALGLTLGLAPTAFAHGDNGYRLRVLSSPADMVTGGDALVRLTIPRQAKPHKVRLFLNGTDVTSMLELDESGRSLTGLVNGLDLGSGVCDYSKPDVGRPRGF